jgi:hypothetical protein
MGIKDRFRSLSVVDSAAAVVAVVAVAGVLWSPKLSNTIARATGSVKPVLVSVDVRNSRAADPERLIKEALGNGSTNLIIRNQPAGSAELIRVDDIRRKLVAVQPDGQVVLADDPNQQIQGIIDARFILRSNATITPSGVVVAGTKLKVGTPVELDGRLYRLNGIVSGIDLQ